MNQLIVLIIAFASTAYGRKIAECDGKSDFIPNPDATCPYNWLYCNGDNSFYCDTLCDESYYCANSNKDSKQDTLVELCADQSVGDFIPNPDTKCEYVWIYCNGDASSYCNTEDCKLQYDCAESLESENKFDELCSGQAVGDFIANPDTSCAYVWIYCNGANSQYCSASECSSAFVCPPSAGTTSAPTTTTTTTTSSTPSTTTASSSSSTTAATTTSATTPRTTTAGYTGSSSTSNYHYVRENCVRGVDERYPYPGFDNYYYQCIDGYLIVQSCGVGYYFDSQSLECHITGQ